MTKDLCWYDGPNKPLLSITMKKTETLVVLLERLSDTPEGMHFVRLDNREHVFTQNKDTALNGQVFPNVPYTMMNDQGTSQWVMLVTVDAY